jgi:hypothetical protein
MFSANFAADHPLGLGPAGMLGWFTIISRTLLAHIAAPQVIVPHFRQTDAMPRLDQ